MPKGVTLKHLRNLTFVRDPRHLDLDNTQLWAGHRFVDTDFVEGVLVLVLIVELSLSLH